MVQAGASFAAGRLAEAVAAARGLAAGADAPAEARQLAEAVEDCSRVFADLRVDLKFKPAGERLTAARGRLAGLGDLAAGAIARLDGWIERVAAAEQLTKTMVVIGGGKVRTATGVVDVAPFFLAPTEVSQREFAAFLDDVDAACRAAGAETWAARLDVINKRTQDVLPKAALAQQLLERRSSLSQGDLPVDTLSWYEAAAYARWQHLALPIEVEWQLAAFGPDGATHTFPWGDAWSNDAIFDRSERVRVDDRGPSWRQGAIAIHHLAGNVAEWLDADPKGTSGFLAGGCYKDRGGEAEAQAKGRLRRADLVQTRPGQGLRVVLRLDTLFGGELPR
ncbi:MAG: SUMF1/EgtB/PvdO family nonheme iron enzyme [Planctomycetota bacterium]